MKQDRLTLTAGFFPAVLMGLLLLLEGVQTRVELTPWALLAAAAGAYVLPTLILRLIPGSDGERCRLRFRPFKRQAVPFVLWISLAGALLAGMLYAYLTYTLDSVWPAIFAHLVNNSLYLFLSYAAKTYAALGVWPYMLLIALFLFCLFLALAMRSLEKLIEKGRIRRFQYRGLRQGLINGFISPGMWLLLILFLVRVLYQ